jgi:tetratricopeptide (TPR) repeat protein
VRGVLILAGLLCLSASLNADDSLVDKIHEAQTSGKYAEAGKLYLQLIATGTDTPEVRSNCGIMLHLAGRNRDALEQFRVALRQKPDLAGANLFAGISEFELGDMPAALAFLEKASHLGPNDPTPLLALGKVYVATRDFKRANDSYAKAVRLDSHLAEAWYGLGVTDRSLAEEILNRAARQGSAGSEATKASVQPLLDAAMEALTRAVELDPNSARTHLLMAESLSDSGKQVEAIAEYQAAMRLDPGMEAAYLGLATQYWKQYQFDQALPLLKKVLLRSPKDPQANAMMADILEHDGELNGAEVYADKALAGNPDLIQTRVVLARIYLAKQQPKLAIAELQKVISADPDGSYHFLLYRAYRATGDQQGAKEAMDEFQKIRTGSPRQ